MEAEIISVDKKLKELGLADSYFFFGKRTIAMRVDKKTGKWTVYIGEADVKYLGNRIIPSKVMELSFDEGVGVIKVLRVGRPYGFGFEVKERDGREP